eukprot:4904830-Pleurochrysis_carterae.AAC.5
MNGFQEQEKQGKRSRTTITILIKFDADDELRYTKRVNFKESLMKSQNVPASTTTYSYNKRMCTIHSQAR